MFQSSNGARGRCDASEQNQSLGDVQPTPLTDSGPPSPGRALSNLLKGKPLYADLEPSLAEFRDDCRRFDARSPYSQYTYFAQARRSGLVKIGRSSDPWQRTEELRVEIGEPVDLLATMRGDFERRYQRHFALLRSHREWFKPEPEILEEVDRLRMWAGRTA